MPKESPAVLHPVTDEIKSRLIEAERTLAERDAELAILRQREAMFRSIVENLDRIFWIIAPDLSRVIYLSPAFERIWGQKVEAVYADPARWAAPIHPDDRVMLEVAMRNRVEGKPVEPSHQLFRIKRADGSQRWIRGRGLLVPALDGGQWYIGIAEDVTELKLAADAESERGALLRLMSEQMPAVIWTTDRDLVFTSSTGRGLADLRREPNEVQGMRLQEYFGTEDPEFPAIAAHRRALAGEAVTYVVDWAGRAYESHVEPLRDATGRAIGVVGMALDVTERKRAEAEVRSTHEELKRAHEKLYAAHDDLQRVLDDLESRVRERTAALNHSNEQLQREVAERIRAEESLQRTVDLYRLLADHATDVISRLTPAGVHLYVSPASVVISGFTPEEIVGRSIFELTHPDDAEMVERARAQVLSAADTVTVAFRLRRKDQSYAWIEATCKRLADSEGAVQGIIAVTRDISERKRVEERLARLQDELAHVTRLSTLGEMATGLAHELNQPLTAVINNLDAGRRLLRAERAAMPEVAAAIGEAMGEAARAGRILQRLRSFVRRGEAERTLVDVNRLVTEVVELAAADLRARRVRLELELGTGLPPVSADAIQVQQVVLNLLWNAVEALGQGGEGERRIVIQTERAGEREVEVAVSDTGPGLTAEVRGRLFDQFFTTKQSGMGLGLPISRSIVEAHGGRLWADATDPEPAGGATFRFTLPVALPECRGRRAES